MQVNRMPAHRLHLVLALLLAGSWSPMLDSAKESKLSPDQRRQPRAIRGQLIETELQPGSWFAVFRSAPTALLHISQG
jgi:hypothetical protein